MPQFTGFFFESSSSVRVLALYDQGDVEMRLNLDSDYKFNSSQGIEVISLDTTESVDSLGAVSRYSSFYSESISSWIFFASVGSGSTQSGLQATYSLQNDDGDETLYRSDELAFDDFITSYFVSSYNGFESFSSLSSLSQISGSYETRNNLALSADQTALYVTSFAQNSTNGYQESVLLKINLYADKDLDGVSTEMDCDDNNEAAYYEVTGLYEDLDDDGYPNLSEGGQTFCFVEESQYATRQEWAQALAQASYNTTTDDFTEDCNDSKSNAHPDAFEFCDGYDNDCDNEVDESDAQDAVKWYVDNDGDGFGQPGSAVVACTPPSSTGYVSNADDCDDSAKDTSQPALALLCMDQDGDGYGDLNNCGFFCATLSGYVARNTEQPDCDDTRSGVFSNTYYLDSDNDTYGDASQSKQACSLPAGYVVNSGDCLDSDASVVIYTFYRDADGDGYGDASQTVQGCQPPAGYVENNEDCDDSDSESYPVFWYPDQDGDGYGDSSQGQKQCQAPSSGVAYINQGGDCDDTNADYYVIQTWYRDQDGDGYGDPDTTEESCLPPTTGGHSYILVAGDCLDTSSSTNPDAEEVCNGNDDDCNGLTDDFAPGASVWYRDADGDGYGNPLISQQSCSQPTGYVSSNQDCDDASVDAQPTLKKWFIDRDGDGYGDSSTSQQSCSQPAGYVGDQGDCDDTNSQIGKTSTWWIDSDGDGYGSNDSSTNKFECQQPVGYVLANLDTLDCDDTDAAIQGKRRYYQDADGDTYGNPVLGVASEDCTAPSGYVTNSLDCDDGDAATTTSIKTEYKCRDDDKDEYGDHTLCVEVCEDFLTLSSKTAYSRASADFYDEKYYRIRREQTRL